MERLYYALRGFLAAGEPNAMALRALISALASARDEIGRVTEPIPFRPEMWEQGTDGLWRKRRQPGDPSI